jgi:CMP-N,N'-diacetyllegionaminic acid synthase
MICGVIPARGGSKGVPLKNIRLFAGKPLIAYTIEAARSSRMLDRVIVSTDDHDIATIARQHGVEVPFLRPPELSKDDVPTLPVLLHAARWLEAATGQPISAIVTLQPTSPFRRAQHIDDAVSRWRDSGADAVVSVCSVEHSPFWMGTLTGDRFAPLLPGIDTYRSRQSLPSVYRLNGAVYVTARRVLFDEARIVGAETRAIVMTHEESLDIDTLEDFELGESMARAARSS